MRLRGLFVPWKVEFSHPFWEAKHKQQNKESQNQVWNVTRKAWHSYAQISKKKIPVITSVFGREALFSNCRKKQLELSNIPATFKGLVCLIFFSSFEMGANFANMQNKFCDACNAFPLRTEGRLLSISVYPVGFYCCMQHPQCILLSPREEAREVFFPR